MARARYLKAGFFTNEKVVGVQPLARLLFQGLWCLADREGRLPDRPRSIKMQVLPEDQVDPNTLLDELAEAGLIVRYEVDGERYIVVCGFVEHQKPHPKEPPSQIPPCPAVEKHGEPWKNTADRAESESESVNGIGVLQSESDKAAAADPFSDAEYRTVCDHWAARTGTLLTPLPAEQLVSWIPRVGLVWVKDAIDEGTLSGARSPKYVLAILERWHRTGRKQDDERTNQRGRSSASRFSDGSDWEAADRGEIQIG